MSKQHKNVDWRHRQLVTINVIIRLNWYPPCQPDIFSLLTNRRRQILRQVEALWTEDAELRTTIRVLRRYNLTNEAQQIIHDAYQQAGGPNGDVQ